MGEKDVRIVRDIRGNYRWSIKRALTVIIITPFIGDVDSRRPHAVTNAALAGRPPQKE